MMQGLTPRQLQKKLLHWFDRHGRKNLPWQHDKSPYRVWVSEIMLQQTQVSTVVAFFQRFMQQFPTLASLAAAAEDEVLHLWTGLGYYQRARNLQKTAKIIMQQHQGAFPQDVSELEKLPGIGRSTAGAIAAIAFAKRAPILDGNVKRVLVRLQGVTEWPGEKNTTDQLWQLAEKLTPQQRPADYTQAIMDLGATLCVRGKPRCLECPLRKGCKAYALGLQSALPKPKPAKTLPIRSTVFLIAQQGQCVFLEKRPTQGTWAGLWSFPQLTGTPTSAVIKRTCQQRFGVKGLKIKKGTGFRHTFTHFHLDILPIFISFTANTPNLPADEQQMWYHLHGQQRIGMPAPVKALLATIVT